MAAKMLCTQSGAHTLTLACALRMSAVSPLMVFIFCSYAASTPTAVMALDAAMPPSPLAIDGPKLTLLAMAGMTFAAKWVQWCMEDQLVNVTAGALVTCVAGVARAALATGCANVVCGDVLTVGDVGAQHLSTRRAWQVARHRLAGGRAWCQ